MTPNSHRLYYLAGLTVSEFLLILLLGCSQFLMLPYAEFLADDAQTFEALRAITEDLHFPIFWIGAYPYLPHGTITIFFYLPLYLIWPSIESPFVMNIVLNCLTSLLLIRIGEKVQLRDAGILAVLFFMLHPTFAGFYSQTIWNVSAVFFLSCLCLYTLLTYVADPKLLTVLYASLALGLLPYTHVLAILYYPAFFIVIHRAHRSHFWVAWITALLMTVPFIVYLLKDNHLPDSFIVALPCAALALTLLTRNRWVRQRSIAASHACLICGGLVMLYFIAFQSQSPLSPFLRIFDTLHSYNIATQSGVMNHLLMLPRLERILWIATAAYGIIRFQTFGPPLRTLFVFVVVPVILFSILAEFSHLGFGATHHRWIIAFPIQFLLIGIALSHIHAYKKQLKLFLPLVLAYLLGGSILFITEVSTQGRPTFNHAMIGERQSVAEFLRSKSACGNVFLVRDTKAVRNDVVTWRYFVETLTENFNSCDTPEQTFYVSIKGIIGWSESLEKSVSDAAVGSYAHGRIKIFQSSSDLKIGQKIYPLDKTCKESRPFVHGMPAITNPRCSV